MRYRLMLGVAQHCLLYSGRSNKSVSYRRGKAPRPTLRILIFKTPLVCTSIAVIDPRPSCDMKNLTVNPQPRDEKREQFGVSPMIV